MTSTARPIVIYGATGYTGRLVAAELVSRKVDIVLAGRSAERLAELASRLGLGPESVARAPLDDPRALIEAAQRGAVLINCAGPFAHTGDAALQACLAASTHYLDTTGEQDWIRRVFEHYDADLVAAGVAAVPGMGFDYLPGDLLCHLIGAPIAPLDRLTVAYHVEGFGMTRGTQRSALEMMDGRDVAYEHGNWIPGGNRPRRGRLTFPDGIGRRTIARYPAGEVITVPRHVATREVAARISTISVAPRAVAPLLPLLTPLLGRLLRTPLKRLLDRAIDRLPEGPPEAERRAARWTVVCLAQSDDGRTARGVVRGPDIYGLTAQTVADGALLLRDGSFSKRGALAPAQAFDPASFLAGLANFGVSWEVLA